MRFAVPKSGAFAMPAPHLNMLEQAMNRTRHTLSLASPTQEVEIYFADDQSDKHVCEALYHEWATSDEHDATATDILLGPVNTGCTHLAIRIAYNNGKPIILWAPDIEWQHTGFVDAPLVWEQDQPPVEAFQRESYSTSFHPVGDSVVIAMEPVTTTSTTVAHVQRCETISNSRCGYVEGYYVSCNAGRSCCNSGWCRDAIGRNNVTHGCNYGKQHVFTSDGVIRNCTVEVGERLLQTQTLMAEVIVQDISDVPPELVDISERLDMDTYDHLTDAYDDLEGVLISSNPIDMMRVYYDAQQEHARAFKENARTAMALAYDYRCKEPQPDDASEDEAWMRAALCLRRGVAAGAASDSNHSIDYSTSFDLRIPLEFVLSGPIQTLMERRPPPEDFFFGVQHGETRWLKMCTGGVYAVSRLEQRFAVTVNKMLGFYHAKNQAEWSRWLPQLEPAVMALCGSDRFILDILYMMQAAAFTPTALILATPTPITLSILVGGYNSLYLLRPAPWPALPEFLQTDCEEETQCNASLVLSYHLNAVGDWLQVLMSRNHGVLPWKLSQVRETACCPGCGPIHTHLGEITMNCTDGTRPHYRSDPLETPTSTNILVPPQYFHEGTSEGNAVAYGDMQNYLMGKTYLLMNETMFETHDFRFNNFMPYKPLVYPLPAWSLKQSEVYPCPTGCHLTQDSTSTGLLSCVSCPPGRARSLYDHVCVPCIHTPHERVTIPHYADTYGFASCLEVEEGGILLSADEEPVADEGYYRFESWMYEKPGETVDCEGDGNPHDGFTFMRCDHPEFCLGNNTCKGHNAGVMCLSCEAGYTNMFDFRQTGTQEDKECEACPSFRRVAVIASFLVLVYAAIIVLVSHFAAKDAKRTVALRGPIVRMFIMHMQVLGALSDTDEHYSRQSPLVFDILLYRPFDLLAMDCFLKKGTELGDELFYVAGYWKISLSLYGASIIVIALMNVVALTYEVLAPVVRVWGPTGVITYFFGSFNKKSRNSKLDDGRLRREGLSKYPVEEHEHYALEDGPGYNFTRRTTMIAVATSRMRIFRQCLVCTLIMYPIILRNILKMITCSASYGPLLRLRANPNVKCGSLALSDFWKFAYGLLAFAWAAAIPLITWAFTFRARGISQYNVETRLSVGLLMQGYTTHCGYWQVVMYIRIAGLLWTNLFLHVQHRVMAKLLIILVSFCISENFQPFDHSQRGAMRRIDRMMHVNAFLAIWYSSSELRRLYEETRNDGAHQFDISAVLRSSVVFSFFCFVTQATWSILVITFNPKWYSTEAKSDHSMLHWWHHIYLWLVDKVRGSNIVLVGWGPAGKYVDFENMSFHGKLAFMTSLQKTLIVCLNSRELFPPAFVQVALHEAFRRAVAGSDATVDVWRIRRHHDMTLCHPSKFFPCLDRFTRFVEIGNHSRSIGMEIAPSIVDHYSNFRFSLKYSDDVQRDFEKQAERLKTSVEMRYPTKDPDTILAYLAITDCTGQEVHSQVSNVAKDRFPLSVRWVAERQIGLEDIEAALQDVSIDIQDFHPDCHRQFACEEARESLIHSRRRKHGTRGGVTQEDDVERGDENASMPRSHHAARLHEFVDVEDDILAVLGNSEPTANDGEDVCASDPVESLSAEICHKVEQRAEAAEMGNLRNEMRRLQGVIQNLNASFAAQGRKPRPFNPPFPCHEVDSQALSQYQVISSPGRSVALTARSSAVRQRSPRSPPAGLGFVDAESELILDLGRASPKTDASIVHFDVPPPVTPLGDSKRSVTPFPAESPHVKRDQGDSASGHTQRPALARAVPNGTARGKKSPVTAAPQGSGEGAFANGLGAAASAAEANRSRKAPEFWAASPASADDTTLVKPALAVPMATAVDTKVSGFAEKAHVFPDKDSRAEDTVFSAGAPPAAADEHADCASEFSDWSMPHEGEGGQAEGGACSQQ